MGISSEATARVEEEKGSNIDREIVKVLGTRSSDHPPSMANKLQDREGRFKSKRTTPKKHETRFALLEQTIPPDDNH